VPPHCPCKLIIDLVSPAQPDLPPANQPGFYIPLQSPASDVPEDARSTVIITNLEEQLRTWSINSEQSKASEGTSSTIPSPYISLLRHQKKGSQGVSREQAGVKMLNESELSYLEYVLEAMYKLIVGNALDKSGVQYRNTFAWRYLV